MSKRRRINELRALKERTRTLIVAYVRANEHDLGQDLLSIMAKLDQKIRGHELASRRGR